MKRNVRWLVLGLLLAGSTYAYFSWDPREPAEMPENIRNAIVEKLELKYVAQVEQLEQDAETLQTLVEHWGERYADQVRLTQKWRAAAQREPATIRVKGDTIHLPPQIVEVEGPCVVSDAFLEGTCSGEMFVVGGRPAARVFWTGLATLKVGDKTLEVDSGDPRLAAILEWEQATPSKALPWLLTLRGGLSTGPGVSAGASLWRGRKRLGYWLQTDYDIDPETYRFDNYSAEADKWRVSGGVAWRLGG